MSFVPRGANMRTSIQLYRDVMRLVDHVAGRSRKADAMKVLIRKEFRKNMSEVDPDKVALMKQRAQKGIQNYLALEAVSKLKPKQGMTAAAQAAVNTPKFAADQPAQSGFRPNLTRVRID